MQKRNVDFKHGIKQIMITSMRVVSDMIFFFLLVLYLSARLLNAQSIKRVTLAPETVNHGMRLYLIGQDKILSENVGGHYPGYTQDINSADSIAVWRSYFLDDEMEGVGNTYRLYIWALSPWVIPQGQTATQFRAEIMVNEEIVAKLDFSSNDYQISSGALYTFTGKNPSTNAGDEIKLKITYRGGYGGSIGWELGDPSSYIEIPLGYSHGRAPAMLKFDGIAEDWSKIPILATAPNNQQEYFPDEVGAAFSDRVDVKTLKAFIDPESNALCFFIGFWGGPVWPNFAYKGEYQGVPVARHRGYYHILLDLDNDPTTGWDNHWYESHHTSLGYYASQDLPNTEPIGAEAYLELGIDTKWTPPKDDGSVKHLDYYAADVHELDYKNYRGSSYDIFELSPANPDTNDLYMWSGMARDVISTTNEYYWAGHAWGYDFLEYGINLTPLRSYWQEKGKEYFKEGDGIGVSAWIETPVDDWGVDVSPRGEIIVGAPFIIEGPPQFISAKVATAYEDSFFKYIARAIDPGGFKITYDFKNYPIWLTSLDSIIYGTPMEGVRDTSFNVIASNDVLADTMQVNISVIPINDRPRIINIRDFTFINSQSYIINLDTCVTDEDNLNESMSWQIIPSNKNLKISLSNNVVNFTSPSWAGISDIKFKVTDPSSASDSLTVRATVDWPLSVDNQDRNIPKAYCLNQNYPNPFNPETTIEYQLPKSSEVILVIYSISGQLITTLVNKNQQPGSYTVQWNGVDDNGHNVASGVYLYSLKTNEFVQTRKMILVR